MKRPNILVLGMIFAFIGVLVWFALERRGESEVPADKHVQSTAGEVEAPVAEPRLQVPVKPQRDPGSAGNTKRVSAELEAKELPGFEVPPDQAIARLRVLSDAGNSEAKSELSRRLAGCTERALRATQFLDELARMDIVMERANRETDENSRTIRIDNGQRRMDQHAAERAACEALPSEVLENWLDPIDEVAQSGITYAMRQYAAHVVAEYESRDVVVADVDRAILRRDKARAYLRQAVSLGDAEGLSDLAYAYFDNHSGLPQLYAVDNYQAYMYAYAGSFGERGKFRELDWVMTRSAEALNARQIADARKQGKRLFDECCLKH